VNWPSSGNIREAQMVNITLRLSASWSERLLHRFDVLLERFEFAAQTLLTDPYEDFRQAAHGARVHRLAARGSNGQA